MRLRIATFTLLALLAALLAATAAPVAAEDNARQQAQEAWSTKQRSVSFEQQLAYEQLFRSKHDFLDESLESTLRAMALHSTSSSYEEYGLALSPEELAEVDRRSSDQESYGEIVEAAIGEGYSEELIEGLDPKGSFGAIAGYWTDNRDGGRLQIAIVDDHPEARQTRARVEARVQEMVVQRRLSSDAVVRFTTAQFGLDEIYDVNERFATEHLIEGNPSDLAMSVSINPRENRADIYAEPSALEAANQLASEFPRGLTHIITAEPGALRDQPEMDPRDDWGFGNWHAGSYIRLRDGNNTLIAACTWGASGRTNTFTYILTAAHCLGDGQFDDNSTGTVGFWNSNQAAADRIGARSFAGGASGDVIADYNDGFVRFYHGVRGDIGSISTDHHGVNADYSCYNQSLGGCTRHITGRATTGQTIIGNDVCAALGRTEAYWCFEIISNDAPVSGYDYLRQIDSNGMTMGGDSGSGWKFGSLMHGIHKGQGTTSGDATFTHAYYVEAYLGRTICGGGGNCDN